MMKNGFTMIELLASVVILGLLLVLTIPSYTSITREMKSSNLDGKISEITIAAKKHAEVIKDEIKDAPNGCLFTDVNELITLGLLESESDSANQIYNPKDNSVLGGKIYMCYDNQKYKVDVYYTFTFDQTKSYQKGLYVLDNSKIYQCVLNYSNKGGINATYQEDGDGDDAIYYRGKEYFKLVKDLN